MTINKAKARKLLESLSDIDSGLADVKKSLSTDVEDIVKKLEKVAEVKTIQEANEQFKNLQKLFKPLLPKLEELKSTLTERDKKLIEKLREKFADVEVLIAESTKGLPEKIEGAYEGIDNLSERLGVVEDREIEFPDYSDTFKGIDKKIEDKVTEVSGKIPDVEPLKSDIASFRRDLDKVNNRGGSANRQINVNSSVMSTKYTDINFGSNTAIRWVATDDDTNKRVNIVASLISGGAGGSGNPAGENSQIQFNDNGSFGASSMFTFVPTVGMGVIAVTGGSSGQTVITQGNSGRTAGENGIFRLQATARDLALSTGTAVAPVNRVLISNTNGATSVYGTLAIGTQGSVLGELAMSGATEGTVKLRVGSVAGNWTLTLPVDDGSNNQVLTTDGNGITRWASVAATGGSGITRTTSIITGDTTADDTASVDRVFVATNSLNLTLPDASGNVNLYTLKNASESSVIVTAIAGDTIDGSPSVLVLLNNQSLDFISDGTNYRIV